MKSKGTILNKFLGFTFWKNANKWKCKPAKDRKANLYAKTKKILLRKKAIAKPIGVTFRELNQLIVGWINYFKIGNMKTFMEKIWKLVKAQSESDYIKKKEKTGLVNPLEYYLNNL